MYIVFLSCNVKKFKTTAKLFEIGETSIVIIIFRGVRAYIFTVLTIALHEPGTRKTFLRTLKLI